MELTTSFSGLTLKNPIMPASGPVVGDAIKMKMIADMGVGAMVTKTISIEGADVPRPCIISGKNHIMNAELWSEYALDRWVNDFLPKMATDYNGPLMISVGYTKADMEMLIPALDPYCQAFEVSTHYVGKDLDQIEAIVSMIRQLTKKPFFMKISPHMPDPVGFCQRVLAAGGNGIVAINSLGPTMTIDLMTRSVVMGNAEGEAWMSGPAIKPVALALIAKIKRAIPTCTIIGVGGITCAQDVLEFLLAGASAVQILSAAMLKGIHIYQQILEALPTELEKYGFKSVQEVIDHHLILPKDKDRETYPVISERCVLCGRCVKNCPYRALSFTDKENIDGREKSAVIVDKTLCFRCGLCKSQCPMHAIQ